ncbi:MAG: exonuclease subunit SbcD [Candidatus Spyradenecus sp.]
MRILHTSDWHLGARLHEQERFAEHRQFLADLVAIAEREAVEVLLVAGDVFDTRQPSASAQALYFDFLAEMARRTPCRKMIVTAGNHDSASQLAAARPVLSRLGIEVVANASAEVSGEVIVVPRADGQPGLAVAAVPFMSESELANLARQHGQAVEGELHVRAAAGFRAHYAAVIAAARAASAGAPVVVMGHCTVVGAQVSDERSERGRAIGGVDAQAVSAFAGADYVALGHLHIAQRVGGAEAIRYSGSPLAMSFAEAAQAKQVLVVDLGGRAGAPVTVRPVALSAPIPLWTLSGTAEAVQRALETLVAEHGAEPGYVAARVTEGVGELLAFWPALDALVEGSSLKLLLKEDVREQTWRRSALLAARAGRTLREMTPLEVAKMRLAEETTLSEAERERYCKMVEAVIGEEMAQ